MSEALDNAIEEVRHLDELRRRQRNDPLNATDALMGGGQMIYILTRLLVDCCPSFDMVMAWTDKTKAIAMFESYDGDFDELVLEEWNGSDDNSTEIMTRENQHDIIASS